VVAALFVFYCSTCIYCSTVLFRCSKVSQYSWVCVYVLWANFYRDEMCDFVAEDWKSASNHKGSRRRVFRALGILEVELLLVGMKVVYPQVLFRGGRQPFRGNNREWYPREASGRARGLRVLERMVIMERCILTMFITEGARRHNSLSALRAFLSWNFSRRGLQTLARCIRVIEWQCPTIKFEILYF